MISAMRAALAAVLVLSVGLPAIPTTVEAKSRPGASAKAKTKAKTSRKRSRRVVRAAPPPNPGFLARDAYYSGEIEKAYELSIAAGERWTAALSAWRLNKYEDAFQRFSEVATDPASDPWLKSSAAFWAARAAVANGQNDQEDPFLRMAAAMPWTFYGMIAEAQLGLEPTISFTQTVLSPDVQLAEAADPLAQLIRTANSAIEPLMEMSPVADIQGFNPAHYPVPLLNPEQGFTVDPALVYALIRQESRFNPTVISPAGAVGLMQLMPATAAITDERFKDRSLLRDPSLNMKVGQDYLNHLATSLVGDDMLMVIAAYNGGPGAVTKTMDRVGWGADPLLMIESLPAKETRDYVEKVMAGYWIYRRQFGQETASLEALASGVKRISIAYDRSHPAASIQQVSLTNSAQGSGGGASDASPAAETANAF